MFFGSKFPGFARCWRIPVPAQRAIGLGKPLPLRTEKGAYSGVERGFRAKIFAQIAERKPRVFIILPRDQRFQNLSTNFPPAFGAATSRPGSVSSSCGPDRRRGGETRGGEVGTAISDALPLKTGHSGPEIVPEEIRRTEGQSRSGASIDDRAAAEQIGDDRAEAREIDARAGIDRRLWGTTQKE